MIQSFYSDFQKETESIVSFGSRIEQTLSRAVRYGHRDLVAKDAMLRSKFWTGLKSQALKNSTHHLYDSIKDFQTLLKEITKVDQEESSFKNTKQQAAQQQHSGQVTTDNTNSELLKQMKELMGCMSKMEEKLEQKNRSDSAQSNFAPNQSSFIPHGGGRGFSSGYNRGYNRGAYRGGYGRGQNNNYSHNYFDSDQNQTGYRGNSYRVSGFRGGHWSGTSMRDVGRGGRAPGNTSSLNE